MKQPINVLSLFDGMSCGQIALNKLGIKYSNYYACEIDKHAMAVTADNYPATKQLGSVTELEAKDIPQIDLLIGGSPCQAFSMAGKRLNFDDPRGKLFFEYVRILKEVKPEYFLMENVRMKQEHEDVITEYLGVKPIAINSSLVSAQNRDRLYWTNIPNIDPPEDKKVVWTDVRDSDIEEKDEVYIHSEKSIALITKRKRSNLLDFEILPPPDEKVYSEDKFKSKVTFPKTKQAVAAMRGRYLVDGVRQDAKQLTEGLTRQYIEFRYDGKTNALTTVAKDNVVVPYALDKRIPVEEFFYRNLTATECERLQTVPSGYTQSVSESQRTRMLGNGWTVDVIAHILSHIV